MIHPSAGRTSNTGRAYSSGSLLLGLKVDTGLLCVLY